MANMNNKHKNDKKPFWLIALLLGQIVCSAALAQERKTTLPQLGELLKEAEGVEVHKQQSGNLLVSWASEDDRKLSEKTLRILERIVGVAKGEANLNMYVSVTAADIDATPGLSQLNSEYKAQYIQRALQKDCVNECNAHVAGVGSAVNSNKIFVALTSQSIAEPALIAFE